MIEELIMQCAVCNNSFTNGAQCSTCHKQLHFDCANTTEAEWNSLGSDRWILWECASCRIIPGHQHISLHSVLQEISELKRQLAILPTLSEAVRIIREELQYLSTCCLNNMDVLDDLSCQLTELERQVTDLEKLKIVVYTMQSHLARVRIIIARTGPVRARQFDKAIRKLIRFLRI